MARKQKHPEHENLERWLVSYADFITLLFATFVVLYALSQTDISEFTKLQDSLHDAFAAQSMFDGQQGIMNDGSNIFDNKQADSIVNPMVLEYFSPKYEQESFEEIKKEIEKFEKDNKLDGISVEIKDKGLVIKIDDNFVLFPSGGARLTPDAYKLLDKIGLTIGSKFMLHMIRVEGHTDSIPLVNSPVYPSNWELSCARSSTIVRYFIDKFKFAPHLFSAIGQAETNPVDTNETEKGRARNRRVEIVVLKNKFKEVERPMVPLITYDKEVQKKMQQDYQEHLKRLKSISEAAINLSDETNYDPGRIINLGDKYINETQRINRVIESGSDKNELKMRPSFVSEPQQ